MLIWGSGGEMRDCGVAAHKNCETCEKERAFHVLLEYRYWGIYWIFNLITSRQYWLLCEICHRGWQLDRKEVEPELGQPNIPFMHRYGLGLLAGAIGSFILVGQLFAAFARY